MGGSRCSRERAREVGAGRERKKRELTERESKGGEEEVLGKLSFGAWGTNKSGERKTSRVCTEKVAEMLVSGSEL